MKKLTLGTPQVTKPTYEVSIPIATPIFAKKDGFLKGLVVEEDRGWILRIGGPFGASGFHDTRTACMEVAASLGFEFFVE